MSDIINGLSTNINKMTNDSSKINSSLPQALAQMEKLYNEFCQDMQKSDLCNSPRRYIVEQGYVKKLLEIAQEYKIQPEVDKWIQKADEIAKKLAEFGIKINPS